MILSTDLSESRLLIPQPVQNLVYVEDHKPVSPFIPVAHSLFNVNPDCVLDAERELERYLRFGQYSRRRPRVWKRFGRGINWRLVFANCDDETLLDQA